MITPDNKWQVIDAYLLGHLDETGRAEVDQKLATDPDFQTDMAMQVALHEQLNREQRQEDETLVDSLMAEWASEDTAVTASPQPEGRVRPLHLAVPFWQRTWVRAAAILMLLIGVCWLGYRQFATNTPKTLSTTLIYEQRDFGMTGTPNEYHKTTYSVTFIADGTDPTEYSTDGQRLTIYLTQLPANVAQWRLRDDARTGGFRLKIPTGESYTIDRNTGNQRRVPAN